MAIATLVLAGACGSTGGADEGTGDSSPTASADFMAKGQIDLMPYLERAVIDHFDALDPDGKSPVLEKTIRTLGTLGTQVLDGHVSPSVIFPMELCLKDGTKVQVLVAQVMDFETNKVENDRFYVIPLSQLDDSTLKELGINSTFGSRTSTCTADLDAA